MPRGVFLLCLTSSLLGRVRTERVHPRPGPNRTTGVPLLPAVNSSACVRTRRFGSKRDGGWNVCLDGLPHAGCVLYAVGARDDTSFDEALARRGCEVHTFDPTMVDIGLDKTGVAKRLGSLNVAFHGVGLGGSSHVHPVGRAPWAWPGVGYGRTRNSQPWRLRTLESIKRELHPDRPIDLVKIDVEGSEWPVLEHLLSDPESSDMLRNGQLFRQLMIEIHFTPQFDAGTRHASAAEHPRSRDDVDEHNEHARRMLHQLERLGFVLWSHVVNDGAPPVQWRGNGAEPGAAARTSCCHDLAFVWRDDAPGRQ